MIPWAKRATDMRVLLSDARSLVERNREEGVSCPCCGQFAKVYKRTFNASMAKALVWLHITSVDCTDRWVDVANVAPKWLLRSREFPKLAFWGLIEQAPNVHDEHKRASGVWAITDLGRKLVQQKVTIPRAAYVYNGQVIRHSDDHTTIREALGTHFDYRDVMRRDE
jgi:hypothetical protein